MYEWSRLASRIRRVRAEVKHLWLSIIGHGGKFGQRHAAAGSQMHNMRLAKRFLVGVLHEVAHPTLNVAVIVDGCVNLAVAISLHIEPLNRRRRCHGGSGIDGRVSCSGIYAVLQLLQRFTEIISNLGMLAQKRNVFGYVDQMLRPLTLAQGSCRIAIVTWLKKNPAPTAKVLNCKNKRAAVSFSGYSKSPLVLPGKFRLGNRMCA